MPDTAKTSALRRFLTFWVAERSYALPARDIAEVIRIPRMTHVPQAPKALLGIANLRGAVVPIVSLRELLGIAHGSAGKAARAIVLDLGSRVGLLVDGVDTMIGVATDRIDARQAGLGAQSGERVVAAFQSGADGVTTKILDLKGMLDVTFAQRVRTGRESRTSVRSVSSEKCTAQVATGEVLVTFEVAGQEFALPLAAVQEVLPAPASRASVPRAEALVLGMTALREGLLPLLSLRGLLGFPLAVDMGKREKVIVMTIAGAQVGLVADRARAIVKAEPEYIDAIPPVLAARARGESQIRAIYRGENGRRLISILAPAQLLREDVMQRLGAHRDSQIPQPAQGDQTQQDTAHFLVFRLGHDEFALPIETVEEVAQVPTQITRLPKTPKFMEGVINLRGTVLPVIDQRRRFDMAMRDRPYRLRLLVVRTDGHRAGLIVDSVSDVLRVSARDIAPAPELTDEIAKLVRGVINLEQIGRIVLLLDPAELLTRGERRLLDSVQAQAAQAKV